MVSVGEPFSKNTMLDRKQSVKSGDLEDLEEVLVDADERERATRALQPLQCADDHAKPGRVDERHLQEVDHDPPLALLEKRGQPLLELRRGVEVELAAELDEMGLGVDLVVGELEVHGPLPVAGRHRALSRPRHYGRGQPAASALAATSSNHTRILSSSSVPQRSLSASRR